MATTLILMNYVRRFLKPPTLPDEYRGHFIAVLAGISIFGLSRACADTVSTVPLSCLFDTSGRPMLGLYGPTACRAKPRERPGSRRRHRMKESSGRPDSPLAGSTGSPYNRRMSGRGDWHFMLHGFANAGYDYEGSNHGDSQGFTTNMLISRVSASLKMTPWASAPWKASNLSMGPYGYAELWQTGETGNGVGPLIDRQHPHNLLSELALTENHQLSEDSLLFLYGALPGEPALGPTVYMHRLSGEDNPLAPISHHWLDSTHVSYGVVTSGGSE